MPLPHNWQRFLSDSEIKSDHSKLLSYSLIDKASANNCGVTSEGLDEAITAINESEINTSKELGVVPNSLVLATNDFLAILNTNIMLACHIVTYELIDPSK